MKIFSTLLATWIAFVFLQSLFFKFTGSAETGIIFNTIADWMAGLSAIAWLAEPFRNWGGITIGLAELIASGLVLWTATRALGALAAAMIMSGAIFFHLFTPLGVNRVVDAAGNTDGGVLFYMACGVWLSALVLVVLHRSQLTHQVKD